MPARRTVAPDIVGCCFLLYAATLSFAVLRAPYAHRAAAAIATDVAIYGGLLAVCVAIAIGLFRRRGWVLGPALLLSIVAFFAGLLAWHVPETAQLPAAAPLAPAIASADSPASTGEAALASSATIASATSASASASPFAGPVVPRKTGAGRPPAGSSQRPASSGESPDDIFRKRR